jgi:hypothetical protein
MRCSTTVNRPGAPLSSFLGVLSLSTAFTGDFFFFTALIFEQLDHRTRPLLLYVSVPTCIATMAARLMSALVMAVCATCIAGQLMPKLVNGSAPQLIRSFRSSKLLGISAPGYARPIMVADIRADTRYDAGFDYGHLLANESLANWNALINSLHLNTLEKDL